MATIANLSIGLSADSARLKKDLDKAKRNSSKWAKGQKKQFASVAASVKLIGVAIAGIGFKNMIGGSTQVSRELTVMSNLIGVSTDHLQKITPSLNRAGISLEKYSDIIKDVNDKVHDFLQTGGGPMADFFEQIAPKVGITADAFKNLSGEEGLALYVSSLEKAGASQEQMTFYMEAIASDSTMLLPLLQNNAAGMNEFALATSEVLSAETIKTLQDMTTNFTTLKTSITNLTINAMAPLLEILSTITKGWRMLLIDFPVVSKAILGITSAIVTATAATWLWNIALAANPVTLVIAGVVVAIAALVAALGWVYVKLKDVFDAVGGVGAAFGLMAKAAGFEFKQIVAYGTGMQLRLQIIFNDIALTWHNVLGDMKLAFAKFADSVADTTVGGWMGMEGGNVEGSIAKSTANNQALNQEFNRLIEKLQDNNTLLAAQNPHMAELAEAFNGGGNTPIDVDIANPEDLTIDLPPPGSLENGTTPGGGGSSDTKDFYETTADSFVNGLKASFTTALSTGDWKGFLTSTMDTLTMGIISSFTEGFFKPFQDSLSSWVGSMFSGMGGGGGDIFGGILSIFGFADGGIVPTTSTSKSYADSVPAMLQPGELVVPKSQVDGFLGGGGGSGQVFNINVTGDVSRLTRSEIVKMMPEIAAGTNMLNKENGRR